MTKLMRCYIAEKIQVIVYGGDVESDMGEDKQSIRELE